MNLLRSSLFRGWSTILRNVRKPTPPPPGTPDPSIQTAPNRLSGEYIEKVREMTQQEIKKPWYQMYGIMLLLAILPTYYFTYQAISRDENDAQQLKNIRTALNTYYYRTAIFTSIVAMIAALRFRNSTILFMEKTNMSVTPMILPLTGCFVGLSLSREWSNPLILTPAILTEAMLMFLLLTRRSVPVPLLYFKTYSMYYDVVILVILGVCLRSYHKERKETDKFMKA